MKIFVGGDQRKGIIFRRQAGPAQAMLGGLARKIRAGGDDDAMPRGKRPLDKFHRARNRFGDFFYRWENVFVKIFDGRLHRVAIHIEEGIKIFIEDLAQGARRIVALHHLFCAEHQIFEQAFGRDVRREVRRQFLIIGRHERAQVGIEQGFVEVEQEGDGHVFCLVKNFRAICRSIFPIG